ncbi:spermine/spermidine synthase domain-containing protein, partial [Streptomyces sp. NPDC000851]
VELDAEMVRLAGRDPALSALNGHAYDDPRVHVTTADAFRWLRGAPTAAYDVVISDLPDPGITAGTKLYSQEFYGLARRALADGGRLTVHAGPVTSRPRVFWTVDATIRAAGLHTAPYRVAGRDSTSDWGFVLAAPGSTPPLGPGRRAPTPRLTGLPPSTLVHPRY